MLDRALAVLLEPARELLPRLLQGGLIDAVTGGVQKVWVVNMPGGGLDGALPDLGGASGKAGGAARTIGSRIRDLIDRPVNAQWLADLYFEVAHAIQRWEPRVRVLKVGAAMTQPGHVTIGLTLRVGAADETPQALRIDI